MQSRRSPWMFGTRPLRAGGPLPSSCWHCWAPRHGPRIPRKPRSSTSATADTPRASSATRAGPASCAGRRRRSSPRSNSRSRTSTPSSGRRRRSIARPAGDYCFELAAGDVLFGSLIGLDEQQGRAGHPAAGPAPRRALEPPPDLPMARRRRPDLSRAERPGRLARAGRARRTGARNRASRRPTARARRSAAISGSPPAPAIEFEISWKTKPDFVFALGVDDKDEHGQASVPVRGVGRRPGHPARARAGGRPGRRPGGRDPARPDSSPGLPRPGGGADPGLLAGRQAIGRPEGRRHQAAPRCPASIWPTSAATSGWSGCGSANGTARSPARPATTRRASTAPTARSSTAR